MAPRWHPAMAPRPLHPAMASNPPKWFVALPPIGSKNPYSYRYLGKNFRNHLLKHQFPDFLSSGSHLVTTTREAPLQTLLQGLGCPTNDAIGCCWKASAQWSTHMTWIWLDIRETSQKKQTCYAVIVSPEFSMIFTTSASSQHVTSMYIITLVYCQAAEVAEVGFFEV